MALRHRELISTITDRENLDARITKAPISKHLTRRPALDELNTNKISNGQKPIAKKAEPKPPTKEVKLPVKETQGKAYSTAQLETALKNETDVSTDPLLVSEYVDDIYKYLQELETKYPIREKFLEEHESTPKMRAILVNWLVQVHMNFGLCLETLHLCISIIDRYLQSHPKIGSNTLQLVGTSALLIACKYEEMYLPDLHDFVYICDNTFSQRQILKMEMSILIALDYSLGKPLSIHFLRRFSKIANVRAEQHNLGKYLLELALIDYEMAHLKPSLQAAAACCLSLSVLTNVSCPSKSWTLQLTHHTTYKYSELKPVLIKFARLLLNADQSKNKSVYSKYAEAKYSKISTNYKLKGPLVTRLAELPSKA